MITKIKNCKLICEKAESDKDLYFEDGKITAISQRDLPYDKVIDAKGDYVSPGFIDIHTHGAGGYDFMDGTMTDILNAAHTHAKFGTTTIFPTAATAPFCELLNFVENVKEAMKQNQAGLPYIAGSHLEGPYFSQEMCGAQNPACIKNPSYDEYNAFFEGSEGTLKRISFAPELTGALTLCDYLREKGIVSAFAHTNATYGKIKPAIDKGCTLATHLYSGMNMVIRKNAYRYLGAVETALLCDEVTVEVIADGCHLPPELLKLIYKIKGSDKICLVTDSIRGASFTEGESILGPKHDGVPCTIKDGVAFLNDFSAFAGSVATADRLIRVMYKEVGVSLPECIKMMSETPARVMGLTSKGKLKEGYDADIVFFNDDINIKKVIIGGKEFKQQWCNEFV